MSTVPIFDIECWVSAECFDDEHEGCNGTECDCDCHAARIARGGSDGD